MVISGLLKEIESQKQKKKIFFWYTLLASHSSVCKTPVIILSAPAFISSLAGQKFQFHIQRKKLPSVNHSYIIFRR